MYQVNTKPKNTKTLIPNAIQQNAAVQGMEINAHLVMSAKDDGPLNFVTDEQSDYLIIAFGTLQVSVVPRRLLNGECLLIMADSSCEKVAVSGDFMMIKICGASRLAPFLSMSDKQSCDSILRQKSPCLYLLAHSAKRHISLNSLDVDEYAKALAVVGRAEFACQYEAQGFSDTSELPNWKLRIVDAYILGNLEKTLLLEDLAAKCQMSPGYFCRLFKSKTGQTPHQYIMSKRVEMACKMLSNSLLPICEIAYGAGFSSQSHMTATFKKMIGFTPKSYRAEQKILAVPTAATISNAAANFC